MKLNNIKKAVTTFNSHNGAAKIMYNERNGNVWCDEFSDQNSYIDYGDDLIFELISKGTIHDKNNKTNYEEIKDAIKNRNQRKF